jgi:hypothetical protein
MSAQMVQVMSWASSQPLRQKVRGAQLMLRRRIVAVVFCRPPAFACPLLLSSCSTSATGQILQKLRGCNCAVFPRCQSAAPPTQMNSSPCAWPTPSRSSLQVFCLLHKMDLIAEDRRDLVFSHKEQEIKGSSTVANVSCFKTSIWDETLCAHLLQHPRAHHVTRAIQV